MNLLKQKQPLYIYGVSARAFDTLGSEFVKDFHAERIKNEILMKQIFYNSKNKQTHLLRNILTKHIERDRKMQARFINSELF